MNQIGKNRKAIIQEATNKTWKDGATTLTKLSDDVEDPLSLMMGYKDRASKAFCKDEEEILYFELRHLHRSEKDAKDFEF